MLFVRPAVVSLLTVAAVSEAANLREEQHRKLQTYSQFDDYASLILDRVNLARDAQGLPALCINKKLQEAAQRHSNDQAANSYMDHTGTDGTSIEERITQVGFDWSAVAENVAAGQPDVDAVMEAWMASPGHRENILGDYTMFGTAYAYNADSTYQHYWTQDFGTGDGEKCEGDSVASHAGEATDTFSEMAAPFRRGYEKVKTKTKTYTKHSKVEDSCSGSQEKETTAPCTDAPILVVDPPELGTTAKTLDNSNQVEGSSASRGTYIPIVVVDPPEIETAEGAKGAAPLYTNDPATEQPGETPLVVVDPPEIGTPTPEMYTSTPAPDTKQHHHNKDCTSGW
ncbi:unnamed protein product [Phytophthora fragariaefolia]|uniref:Unnamed protein product n=1 Tax=Phytophthora fragariaefolia TaxID=1490495 RepID=A0A9W6Y2M4_9STRA|nr:unnamed protein product [Phytophthora fragariaefolia]